MSINLNYIALKSKKETAVCEALFYVKYLKFTCVDIFLTLFTLWCKDYHYIQLFRERLSEKVHATIPKGIVGGFEFTVLQRNLKEWHERPWTYVCEC